MRRFLFDYIYDSQKMSVSNELLSVDLDSAIDFIDEHFMELHFEEEIEISAIRLRNDQDDEILLYRLHLDAISR